ncbi:leucine-rich repeat domain-containing protein, partial [Chloroflexota bacterium]
ISDITPVSALTNLWYLYLGGNQISDMTAVSPLTSLRKLYLDDNQISDISPVSALANLERLYLYDNQISDISPVSALANLERLYLYDNQISDISPVSALANLDVLALGSNQISDISPLVANSGLSSGDFVDLQGNPLSADSLNTYIPQLEARGVEVLYDVIDYTLTIDVSGNGNTSPAVGSHVYSLGTVVNLSATPNAGFEFSHWSGDASGTSPLTTITMDTNKDVTANFSQITYNLTVGSTDGGSVTTPGEGTFTYNAGDVVNLVAAPATNFAFVNWTGDVATVANVSAAATTVTMNGNYSITGNFTRVSCNLTVSSTAGGSVSTPGEGIFTYNAGTVVNLIVGPPAVGYQFVNWTGDVATVADVNSEATTITMNADYSITANFAEDTRVIIYSMLAAPGVSRSLKVSVGYIHDPLGLGAYDFSLAWDPAVIQVNSILGGAVPFDSVPTQLIDNGTGTASFSAQQTTQSPGPPGIVVAYVDITTVGTVGSSTVLNITINALSNTSAGAITAADSDGQLKIVDYTAETKMPLGQDQVDGVVSIDNQGAVGVAPQVWQIYDPVSGEPVSGISLTGYDARLDYDGADTNVLSVNAVSPWVAAPASIDNGAGQATFGGTRNPGGETPVVPASMTIPAFIHLRLISDCLTSCNVTLTWVDIVDADSIHIPTEATVIKTFRRGDTRADGAITIGDALFATQYLAGIREIDCVGGDTDKVNPVNMASVKHDGDFDIKTIADVLYIRQYLAGLRDANFIAH